MPIVDATHKQTCQSHLCCDPIGFTCLDFLEILTYYISGMDNKSKKACKIELWFEGAEKIEREGEEEFFFCKIGESLIRGKEAMMKIGG